MNAVLSDNPIRIARLRQGMSQNGLADLARLSRTAVISLEDGRTDDPAPETIAALAEALGMDAGALAQAQRAWRIRNLDAALLSLSPHQRGILALQPAQVAQQFPDFIAWRSEFAPSSIAFAILLGLNHSTLKRYEAGLRRTETMPRPLTTALLNVFKLSPDYVFELAQLPVKAER